MYVRTKFIQIILQARCDVDHHHTSAHMVNESDCYCGRVHDQVFLYLFHYFSSSPCCCTVCVCVCDLVSCTSMSELMCVSKCARVLGILSYTLISWFRNLVSIVCRLNVCVCVRFFFLFSFGSLVCCLVPPSPSTSLTAYLLFEMLPCPDFFLVSL